MYFQLLFLYLLELTHNLLSFVKPRTVVFLSLSPLTSCVGESPPSNAGPMAKIVQADGHVFYIDRFEFPNRPNQVPIAEMDFATAKEHCKSVGKRLCSIAEWKSACGHSRFPYGEQYKRDTCHTNQPNSDGHTSLMHGRTKQVPSGAYRDCHGTTKVYDMVGNLEEWVLDDFKGQTGNLAGGAWYTYWRYADCSVQYSHEPDYRLAMDRPTDSAGVRCCWSTESSPYQQASKKVVATVEYNPNNEVEVMSGTWMDKFEYPNQDGHLPLVNISWDSASELCKQNGKSLCPTQLWENTCLEQKSKQFIHENPNGKCNIDGDSLQPSSFESNCKTEHGVINLIGNAWEWTQDEITVPEFQIDPTYSLKEIRGGSFFSDKLKGQCTPKVGYPIAPSNLEGSTLGFRCCRLGDSQLNVQSSKYASFQCPDGMQSTPLGCMDEYEFPNKVNEIPLSGINLRDAYSRCLEVGKHLCTDDEWYAGCAGSEHRRWSYGNSFNYKQCAHAGTDNRGGARPSGSFTTCNTPNGHFDLTGNLWEWTSEGHLRGGNWNFSEGMGQCYSMAEPAPEIQNDEIGFRCCATVEEVEIMLQYPSKE